MDSSGFSRIFDGLAILAVFGLAFIVTLIIGAPFLIWYLVHHISIVWR